MDKAKLDKWIWVLIFGGLLAISFGWFLRSRIEAAGWTLMVAGAIVAATGAVMIFVRSRMGP